MIEKREINGVSIRFTDESKELPSVIAVSTVKIAEIFGKKHSVVLDDFNRALKHIEGSPLDWTSSTEPLYADMTYRSKQGKELPAMAISEKLFYLVVLAYDGKKAFDLRQKFIDTFFDMRLQLMEATVAFQNRSSSQRSRRRKELKESHKEEIIQLEADAKHKDEVIAMCMEILQKK